MDRQNPKGKELLEDIVTKRSFVSGIFAGKDFVAVIYVNREKNRWQSLLDSLHSDL